MVYRKGEYDPDLTYGEVRSRVHATTHAPPTAADALPLRPRQFPLDLFSQFVERAFDRGGRSAPEDEVFVDVGSGCGRLVLGTALLWPEMGHTAKAAAGAHARAL